jgi:hypothetical protein
MPSRCPKCGKEIDYLAAEMTDYGILRVHPDGTPDYEEEKKHDN